MQPFLKWAGGKRQLLPVLKRYFPKKFNRYFEPFVGGGAVFFSLNHPRSYLSDTNEELICCYRVIRSDVNALIDKLKEHYYEKEYYYSVRAQLPDSLSEVERAARMIYLNRCGFNGLYRVNQKGQFNVPFGRYKNPKICDERNLNECSQLLQDTVLRTDSFEKVIDYAKQGDFIYFDPPYIPLSESSSFTQYTSSGFSIEDQRHLAEVFATLVNKGVSVLLSNSDTPEVEELYRGYTHQRVLAHRRINSQVGGRGRIYERLIIGTQ